jgi:hypothetical protein
MTPKGLAMRKVDFKGKSAVLTFDPAKAMPQELPRATGDAGCPSAIQRVQ